MWPELGQIALILALLLSVLLVGVALSGFALPARLSRPLALSHSLCVCVAFAMLAKAFLDNDFSVLLVANNSHTLLPWYYRLTATWGNHEGSMLLWSLMLSWWMVAVALFTRRLADTFVARVLAVMGGIAVGFELFILLTSNPFLRVLPELPLEGGDLNPLLQDLAMIVHPPTLYAGYVGLSVAFAFALAALWEGRLDAGWARQVRPWTLAAWCFLTAGITLGSWWAYYELGWGGWWFWDPVENASFMPWLVATALLHSLAVTERRGAFRGWTLLLAILAFALSLLGTFLVRSGVLTSVHAFASDPARGLFILLFLGVVVGGALLLYALRAGALVHAVRFSALSRESLLLVNNVLLLVAAATVLLGTLFPLIMDALGQGRYSVGPPYFNRAVGPLLLLVVLLLALAPVFRWQQTPLQRLREGLLPPALALAVLAVATFAGLPGVVRWAAGAGALAAFWVWLVVLFVLVRRGREQGLRSFTASWSGMLVAHAGVALVLLGIVISTAYSESRDVRLAPGESYSLGGFDFRLESMSEEPGPNYRASVGRVSLHQGGALVAMLSPEKRQYVSGGKPMTEAAIRPGVLQDVYVALGEPLGDGAWSLRLHVKPGVRWIWSGAIVMALGGLLALWGRRCAVTGVMA